MLKQFYESLKETYTVFMPVPRQKREDFLDKVRDRVDFYKPKIEERCNLNLGEVKVKDNSEFIDDVLYGANGLAWKDTLERGWRSGRVPSKTDFMFSYSTAAFAELLMKFPIFLYNSFSGAEMRYFNSTIYVPFYFMNRFMDASFIGRIRTLDHTVVHELSHSVWYKIEPDKYRDQNGRRVWFEGFATYCEDEYFSDLYQDGTERLSDRFLPKLYIRGKKQIEELVEQHGSDIVLEIPKKWKNFK